MSIVRHEPWTVLSRWHRDFDQFFGTEAPRSSVAWIPSVDVREEQDRFVVQADLPGVAAGDVDVTAEKGVLTIRGERKQEKREERSGYERIERVAGNFVRRFTLPETAQADAIKARLVNGVLEVSIPKQPEPAAKKVTVEAA